MDIKDLDNTIKPNLLNETNTFGILERNTSHNKAAKEKPPSYGNYIPVPTEKIDWNVDYPDYNPNYVVTEDVLSNDSTKVQNGWADPEDINETKKLRKLISFEGDVVFDKEGYPINPRGRTGITGRGELGKWGVNNAVDVVLTRINQKTNKLEVILIKRNNGEWAIPGGFVDLGEELPETKKRELEEETGVVLDLTLAVPFYQGYVDDPRNTDQAWIETSASHLHLEGEEANVAIKAGDDAEDIKWEETSDEKLKPLYASHRDVIRKAISVWQGKSGKLVDINGLVIPG